MVCRNIKILGTGIYLPVNRVSSIELDRKFGKQPGWCKAKHQIESRYYANEEETSSYMGTKAVRAALQSAQISAKDLDLIISASAVPEQPIPTNAALIQSGLELSDLGIPCFDINATCVSFMTACDIAADLLMSKKYRHIAIVSSEVPTRGLNKNDLNTSLLFSDGAAAIIVSHTSENEETKLNAESAILASLMRTYSKGAHLCQVRGGGTRLNPGVMPDIQTEAYQFAMDGKGLYKLASDKLPALVKELLQEAEITLNDIDVFISHQASPLALLHLHKKLGFPDHKIMKIINTHGNQVAASIPFTLHEAVSTGRLKRGQLALLLGTAAGLSLASMILRY